MIHRRSFLGSLAWLAVCGRAHGQEIAGEPVADLVIRRPRGLDEDPVYYDLSQSGPYPTAGAVTAISTPTDEIVVQRPLRKKRPELVVLSHGVLTDPRAYSLLMTHLATHGFVVAAPVHDDGVLRNGMKARQIDTDATGRWDVEHILNDTTRYERRVESCSAPLAILDRISEVVGEEVEASRPILIGHEFGAFCSQLSMGARTRSLQDRDLSDPRWYASVLLSPQGPGALGLDHSSWNGCTRPLGVAVGNAEQDFFRQESIVKASAFKLSPAGNKHLFWIKDGTENLYAGPGTGTDPARLRTFEDLLASVTGFCIAYGRRDEGMFSMISGDWIQRQSFGRVQTRYR